MSQTTITIGTQTITLVATPPAPGFSDVQWSIKDTVGSVTSIFTGQVQTQTWPGGDLWSGTLTLPPMKPRLARQWTSFLMQLRGIANAFQVTDPLYEGPEGNPSGTPVANTAGGTNWNAAMTTTLYTRGWMPSMYRLLLPGDQLQLGYRLHQVVDQVNSDANGDAAINIWPSIREQPADGAPIILKNPMGLFRLAKNQRDWHITVGAITSTSFQINEYR